MSKIVLDDVVSGYNLSTINDNFQKIEDELNNKVLYRDNLVGEPNSLQNDIDVNGKKLINVGGLDVNGVDIGAVAQAAADSADAAAVSEANAASSEADAEAALADFLNRYQGPHATPPTVRTDGTPLQEGDLYFSTVAPKRTKVWDGSVWINAGSVIQAYINKPDTPVIATAGQTIVPVPNGYDARYIDVWVNGFKVDKPEIDISSGSNIVFTTPLNVNDEVTWVAFSAVELEQNLRLDLATSSGASLIGYKGSTLEKQLSGFPNVFNFFIAGESDSTDMLQRALDSNQVCVLPIGKYYTSRELIASPNRNRNNGFISLSFTSRYPYTQQTGGPVWDGTQETVIYYNGSTSTSTSVIRASYSSVGVEPTSTFDTTVWGFTLKGITLDANSKAGFGFYGARVQDLQLEHLRVRGATVAGISINGTYSGSVSTTRCYLNPGRGFELGAADTRWGWTTQDKVNGLCIFDLHCDANGSAGTFRQSDTTLRKEGCGIYFGPHRGVNIVGAISENNFGANVVFEPTSSSNSIKDLYTELGCKYAPNGAGTDAISLGYATDQIGLMFIGSSSATHNRVADYSCATDKVLITGSEPTPSRKEGAFELQNVSLAGGLIADWANYRLVNCSLELESISGYQPVGAYTLKGGVQFGAGLNVLNNYTEGTWTPSFGGSTVAGTGWSYSVQSGEYTRIGRHVFITGRITLSGVSTDATGQIAINGLPFVVKNSNSANSSIQISNVVNLSTAVVSIDGAVSLNSSKFTLQKRTAAAVSASSLVLADLSATTTMTFSGHYVTV